jgi:cytidylate kinase
MRPLAQRVKWLMEQLETDDAELAEAEIRRSDQSNATRMHEQFGVNWGDPVHFDLVLNTERLSVDTCVQQIKPCWCAPIRRNRASRFCSARDAGAFAPRCAIRSPHRERHHHD